jgi:RsiW-degrading membrane proteinase PrsW (M82 family)/RNA polymerase subunit RPABC4/transcription elongation factor Spt4
LGVLRVITLALAPGIFWMWLIYRWDRHQPEPRWLVIRTFLWGMVLVIPIGVIEFLLTVGGLGFDSLDQIVQTPVSLSDIAYMSFVVAGMTEELGKFLVVRWSIYKSPYFDDSTDGIIYGSAVALGFATLENVGYALSYGWEVMLLRGPISTLSHVLFSVIWSYPLALHKIGYPRATAYLWLGLFGSMIAHGFFDFLLFTQTWYALLSIPLFGGLVVALVMMLRHSRRISPFRNKVAELYRDCPRCGAKIPSYANFCPTCGAKIDTKEQKTGDTCGNCGSKLESNARFCTACGSRITQKPWKN